ncbi:glutathione S-transferase [Sphingomonas laterariae]|uniref:Glutathione S-transferase n=1 Tax=Edaphosphingomonas laterariae TaxID=861865 RepID=A0A239F2M6_9SPHN|nr:glutathione S-transferase family protein [Sphingomonas laterariae]SNS51156.1 glutathione S-transferase [Sphingomonas laterariae]
MGGITVHHLENSKSQRILWLLEELELPYEVVRYQRMMGAAPPELTRVHPLGKAPSVEIDGLVMAESAAIIQYVLMRFGQGRLAPPADSPDYAKFLELLHYPESSLALRTLLPLFIRLFGVSAPMLEGYAAHGLGVQLDHLDAMLGGRDYLIGDAFTAADLQLTHELQFLKAQGQIDDRPTLLGFVDRMESRPAWQRAVARGGPFNLGFGA